MKIDSIKNGIVIDHITAGKAMQLYHMLELERLECRVAILQNVPSRKMGKKDIIKIDSDISINTDMIGFVSPNATINVIRSDSIVEKKQVELPRRLVNIIRCKNPRCITTTEQEIDHIFELCDGGRYRCFYCETRAN
ncbi:MAG: aspartate carbamoyltransferase regulatory subunit [Ruminococcaceae bacterium]|nr:aspartate carbamoyltransferase regulatory subunit [Oscillospiraceae bacterium]